ncbi:MAG: NAD(+)/NADH kinase [Candidatus Diapherotrites archaeon]|nr:NAD(+)/NADH kinase [Candidatus Diapherotrites archaeon]
MRKISSVGIAGHFRNDLAKKTAKRAIKVIQKHGVKVRVAREFFPSKYSIPIAEFDVDLVLAFGGDGTLLHIFRDLGTKRVPVFGVNCGEVGYLMALHYENFDKKLPVILSGDFVVEERTRIAGIADGNELPLALNEIVMSSMKSATIMRYGLKVNSEYLWKDSADGAIVSTPTGSTAYSLSARGPIIQPSAKALLITPINSMADTKPLVVGDDSKIELFGINSAAPCEVVVDGQTRLKVSESLSCQKSRFPALLARLSRLSFASPGKRTKMPKSLESGIEASDAPPSARFVLKILEMESSLTQKEIINATGLPARTVRRALNVLVRKRLVLKKPFLADPRQHIYILQQQKKQA